MNQSRDRNTASGLLTELDNIRSLLGESSPDDEIPLLEDTVEDSTTAFPILCDAATAATELPLEPAELERIPLLDDPIPDFEDDEFDATENQGLQTAIRERIDATLEHWVNETLPRELTLLRARLLDAVWTEVHEYVAARLDRDNPTGKPHGE